MLMSSSRKLPKNKHDQLTTLLSRSAWILHCIFFFTLGHAKAIIKNKTFINDYIDSGSSCLAGCSVKVENQEVTPTQKTYPF